MSQLNPAKGHHFRSLAHACRRAYRHTAESVAFAADPVGFLQRLHQKQGEMAGAQMLGRPWVFLGSPKLVGELYTAPKGLFTAGAAKKKIFEPVLGTSSVLLLDGEAHATRRKLLVPDFRQISVTDLTPSLLEQIDRVVRTWQSGTTKLYPRLHRLVLELTFRGLFGTDSYQRPELWQAVQAYSEIVSSKLLMFPFAQKDFGPRSPWGHLLRTVEWVRREVAVEIEHLRHQPGVGILSRLLAHGSLTTNMLVDETLTMLVAGHEITSAATAWMLYAITRDCSLQDALVDECKDFSDNGINSQVLVPSFVKESLRYFHTVPAGSARQVAGSVILGGREIALGTTVNVSACVLHRLPEMYDEPNKFRAERFIDWKPYPYSFVPFGGGIRRCLGMALAMTEMQIVATAVLRHFTLRGLGREKPVRRGMFLVPHKGVACELRYRRYT